MTKPYGAINKASSDIVALSTGAAVVDVTLPEGPKDWEIGFEFFSDAAGTPSVPTGGTVTPTVETHAEPGIFQALGMSAIDLSVAHTQEAFNSYGKTARLTFASITGGSTTHVRANVVGR